MSNYVPGLGPPDAKIVLVGEAPGEHEVRMGQPFVGPSGKLLNSLLSGAGIVREDCYITNVVKQRPPNNDFGVFYVDKQRKQPSEMLLKSIASLREELDALKPNIIVPLGGEALRAITGRRSIDLWRGSLLHVADRKVCATFHPAFIMRMYRNRITSQLDFRRIAIESKTRELILPTHSFILGPPYDQAMSYIEQCTKAKRIAFDIETTGPHVRCLGLSCDPSTACCIPFMATQIEPLSSSSLLTLDLPTPTRNSFWTPTQEYEILSALNTLFRLESVEKVAHNFPFDAMVLSHEFGLDTSTNLVQDTMVAHHTCYSELPKGLEYLASIYTRTPYWADHDASVDKDHWLYNCKDTALTLEISYVLDKEMEKLGVKEYYTNAINPALLAYTRAQTRGVRVNSELREQVAQRTRKEMDAYGKVIQEYSKGQIENPNSKKQVKDFCYTTLGLKVVEHPKTGNPTIDEDARGRLKKLHPEHLVFFDALDQYSERSHDLSDFLEVPLDVNSRIYTHYWMSGTDTGRLSSKAPLGDGKGPLKSVFPYWPGMNLQNRKRGESRRMFISDPGFSFIKADLSQAEFRIVVWKARIQRIIDKYLTDPNYDVHKWLASLIYNKLEKDVQKDERTRAKNGVYAGQYGVYYVTAARTYGMELHEAKYVLDRFKGILPEIENTFWKETQQDIARNRCIQGELGRRRLFFDRLDDELYRSAYAHTASHLVADIINRAFTLADKLFIPEECFPLLQVHDEIVFSCRDNCLDKYVRFVRKIMEYPIKFKGVDAPLIIPAEIAVGKNWFNVEVVK